LVRKSNPDSLFIEWNRKSLAEQTGMDYKAFKINDVEIYPQVELVAKFTETCTPNDPVTTFELRTKLTSMFNFR
jgi:hypothetical protein